MDFFWIWSLIGFALAFIYGSFFEWSVHKFLMHRPFGGFQYAFRAHAVVHHQVFKADHTYHLIHDHDKETIPMAWWNGPVLILMSAVPFALLSWVLGQWGLVTGAAIGMTSYYVLYERIHWCMHLPKARRLEQSWLFRRLNGHHLLHHRYMHKNYNVVFPLADLCLGTLMLRAKTHFKQALGPSVPNVQPQA